MKELRQLPNISKVIEGRLASVGINDAEALMKAGSKEAFTRLYLAEGDTCFNTLCTIEGAIQGIRWHYLPDESKKELKAFFNSFKSR